MIRSIIGWFVILILSLGFAYVTTVLNIWQAVGVLVVGTVVSFACFIPSYKSNTVPTIFFLSFFFSLVITIFYIAYLLIFSVFSLLSVIRFFMWFFLIMHFFICPLIGRVEQIIEQRKESAKASESREIVF